MSDDYMRTIKRKSTNCRLRDKGYVLMVSNCYSSGMLSWLPGARISSGDQQLLEATVQTQLLGFLPPEETKGQLQLLMENLPVSWTSICPKELHYNL